MKYTVAEGRSIQELEKKVAGLIEEGWIPQGGVSVIVVPENEYNIKKQGVFQAMIKTDVEVRDGR